MEQVIKKQNLIVAGVVSVLLFASLLLFTGCSKTAAGTWYQEAGYSATLEVSQDSYTLKTDGDTVDEGSVRLDGDVCYLETDGAELKFGLSSDGKTLTCSTQSSLVIAGTWYSSEADAASHPRSF